VCSDGTLAPAACCALLSAAQNLRQHDVALYYIAVGATAAEADAISGFFDRANRSLRIIRAESPDGSHLRLKGISSATLVRLYLDELLPADIDRVLYIDADVLCVGGIDELLGAKLGDCCIGAVEDYAMVFPAKAQQLREQARLPSGSSYFNAGILVLDWRKAQADNLFANCRKAYEAHGASFAFADQDALNFVVGGQWKKLDPKFNAQAGFLPVLPSAHILHFTGREKPWGPSPTLPGMRYRAVYRRMLAHSNWTGFIKPIDWKKLAQIFLRHLRQGKRRAMTRAYLRQQAW
jgi:lipopolysaccharide biosynthesis glycosyltransferase